MPSSSAAPADYGTAARFSPAQAASNWTIRAAGRPAVRPRRIDAGEALRDRAAFGPERRRVVHDHASGPSHHNLRIDGLEFTARIVDLHLPVDTALRAIDVGGPRRDFAVQGPEVADAAPA